MVDSGRVVRQREAHRGRLIEAKRAVARDAAVQAGVRLFAERGFGATAMADVARESGVSLKALYDAVGSKDQLFSAVIDELFSHNLLPALQREASDEDPGERVLALIADLLAAMEADRAYFMLYARGSADVPESLRLSGRDPFEPYITLLAERLRSLITAAQDAGRAGGVSAEAFATAIVATVIALAREAVIGRHRRPLTDLIEELRGLFAPLLGQGEENNR
jgi:AcrR family transcriptional regulator